MLRIILQRQFYMDWTSIRFDRASRLQHGSQQANEGPQYEGYKGPRQQTLDVCRKRKRQGPLFLHSPGDRAGV